MTWRVVSVDREAATCIARSDLGDEIEVTVAPEHISRVDEGDELEFTAGRDA